MPVLILSAVPIGINLVSCFDLDSKVGMRYLYSCKACTQTRFHWSHGEVVPIWGYDSVIIVPANISLM